MAHHEQPPRVLEPFTQRAQRLGGIPQQPIAHFRDGGEPRTRLLQLVEPLPVLERQTENGRQVLIYSLEHQLTSDMVDRATTMFGGNVLSPTDLQLGANLLASVGSETDVLFRTGASLGEALKMGGKVTPIYLSAEVEFIAPAVADIPTITITKVDIGEPRDGEPTSARVTTSYAVYQADTLIARGKDNLMIYKYPYQEQVVTAGQTERRQVAEAPGEQPAEKITGEATVATQMWTDLYARLTGDTNSPHILPGYLDRTLFAKSLSEGDTIAHGAAVLSSSVMHGVHALGQTRDVLRVSGRFTRPVVISTPDNMHTFAPVLTATDQENAFGLSVINEQGKEVISGGQLLLAA